MDESKSLLLLDEKTLSDLENDAVRAETERAFPPSIPSPFPRSWSRSLPLALLPKSRALAFAFALLPSFVQARLRNERPHQEKQYPTAYLDGMRGLAALFVFFCHYSYTCFVITIGYGYGDKGEYNSPLLLPIVRLLFSGPPMVCVFFVISGYALSLKPLKLMRSHSWDDLMTTMSSSVFRRGMRLFLPTTASTFAVLLLLRLGFYEPTRAISGDKLRHRNVIEYHPVQLASFNAQVRDWTEQMFHFMSVFTWAQFAGSTSYDVHLWTIPVEFRSSLMLFLVIIALSKLRSTVRLPLLAAIILFVLRQDRWELTLFCCGMFIAELDLIIAQANKLSSSFMPLFLSNPSKSSFGKSLWIGLSVISLYLMSQPDDSFDATPGWRYLSTVIPAWFSEKYRFWQVIGSITFVLSVSRLPLLQKPFNSPLIQYLGKISYALYLMHGPVMHVVGYVFQEVAWNITGYDSRSAYIFGFILGAIVNIPLVIWAADVFWRFVDTPSVKFARWVEKQLVVQEDSPTRGRQATR
jgi:peptidoglycan/LPS O-acetylase OafA/YrhL